MTAQWKQKALDQLRLQTPKVPVSNNSANVHVHREAAVALMSKKPNQRFHLVMRRHGAIKQVDGNPVYHQILTLALCHTCVSRGLQARLNTNSPFRQPEVAVFEDDQGAWIHFRDELNDFAVDGDTSLGDAYARTMAGLSVNAPVKVFLVDSMLSTEYEVSTYDLILASRKVQDDEPFPYSLEEWGIRNQTLIDLLEPAYATLMFEFAASVQPGEPGVRAVTRDIESREWGVGSVGDEGKKKTVMVHKPQVGIGALTIALMNQPEFRDRLLADEDNTIQISLKEADEVTGNRYFPREAFLTTLHDDHLTSKATYAEWATSSEDPPPYYNSSLEPRRVDLELGKCLEDAVLTWARTGGDPKDRPDLAIAGEVVLNIRLVPTAPAVTKKLLPTNRDETLRTSKVRVTLNLKRALEQCGVYVTRQDRIKDLLSMGRRWFNVSVVTFYEGSSGLPPTSPWVGAGSEHSDNLQAQVYKWQSASAFRSKGSRITLLKKRGYLNAQKGTQFTFSADYFDAKNIQVFTSRSEHTQMGVLAGKTTSRLFYSNDLGSTNLPAQISRVIWVKPL